MILLLFTERLKNNRDKEGQYDKCEEDDAGRNDEATEHRIKIHHLYINQQQLGLNKTCYFLSFGL